MQINLNATPPFLRDLGRLMKARGFRHKAEAIRVAVHEAVERLKDRGRGEDFRSWIGLARREPLNPAPRFADDVALWEGK